MKYRYGREKNYTDRDWVWDNSTIPEYTMIYHRHLKLKNSSDILGWYTLAIEKDRCPYCKERPPIELIEEVRNYVHDEI